jgi:hypothetical protein
MLWPVFAKRTASSLNSSVYLALVVAPIDPYLLADHSEPLSKGSGFQGQGQFRERHHVTPDQFAQALHKVAKYWGALLERPEVRSLKEK